MLQQLRPSYPLGTATLNDRYWARHFALISHGEVRVLVLNSSAFHGEGRILETYVASPSQSGKGTVTYEFDHGRISEHTLQTIKEDLKRSDATLVNILLCHHHPHEHSELGLGSGDLMKGGQGLLSLLGSGLYGRWIVIHGHKHHPKIEYAAGGADSPIVFAAGSVGAILSGQLGTHSRNQFYIVEFPLKECVQHGLVGRFRTWDWAASVGWQVAPMSRRLPGTGGFGIRTSTQTLATQIAASATTGGESWPELLNRIPELEFLLPQDLDTLVTKLQAEPNILVQQSVDGGPPTHVGRKS